MVDRYIISRAYDGKPRKQYPKICRMCGVEYWIPKFVLNKSSFCSLPCKNKSQITRVSIQCGTCGVAFDIRKSKLADSKHGIHFCSTQCKNKAQRLTGRSEIHPKHYKDGRGSYRKRALNHFGSECQKCGYKEHTVMLDVDHIDGDRQNGSLNNLQVLCVWCHALKTRKIEGFNRFASIAQR